MKELISQHKLFFVILAVLFVGFLLWYFFSIVACVIIAGVVSIIGTPLVNLFDRIRIRKFKMPHTVSVVLTMIIIISVFVAFLAFIIPIIVKEANMIRAIDTGKLIAYYQDDLTSLENFLVRYGILAPHETIVTTGKEMVLKVMNIGMISDFLTNLITIAGTFFFYLFTVLFLSFFFLLDPRMLPNLVISLVPESSIEKVTNIMYSSRSLLTRYFIGLISEVMALALLVSVGLSIIGVSGAFAIGFFAGIMNIIPYLGYFIASIVGVLLAVTSSVSAGDYAQILPIAIKTIIVMIVSNMIDNSVFQPYFFGKSVEAHPVEIFLVIIAAGFIGGVFAMIVAVPAYTFLRIIAREFFSEFRFVQKLTNRMK
jgi:predicted PurR-regulated permease PerM